MVVSRKKERRHRITEVGEEIQMREVASRLFRRVGPRKKLFAETAM